MNESTFAVTDSTTSSSASESSYNYYVMIKLHAALGIFAWIGLLPCAVHIARQSKQVFNGGSDKCPTWLKLHIVLFVLVVLLTAASFVCAAIPTNGYNFSGPVPSQAHQGLGLALCFLLLVGIALSGFRMPAGKCKSKIGEKLTWWIHISTGNFCVAIGASVCIVGVMRTAGPAWLILFPIGMIAFHLSMNEVIGRCVKLRPVVAGKATPNNAIVEIQDHHLQTVCSNSETSASQSNERAMRQKNVEATEDLKVRKRSTIIYLTIVPLWAASFAILYAIVWHPDNV